MKLRMSPMAWWIESIAPIDAGCRVVAFGLETVGDAFEGEPDRVQVLDDPVVQVLRDPVALLGDGEPTGSIQEPGIRHRDPGVHRERLDQALIVLR